MSRPLWPSVRMELAWASALLPLACRDLGASWCTEVLAFDASHLGAGIVGTSLTADQARSLAQYSERWRFSRREEMQYTPRTDALYSQTAEAADNLPDVRNMVDKVRVPPIPGVLWNGSWKLVLSAPWSRVESQAVL